jgi:hypothetical protein
MGIKRLSITKKLTISAKGVNMRILVVNDDGIRAEGIERLARMATLVRRGMGSCTERAV